jgi:hypothetical protein
VQGRTETLYKIPNIFALTLLEQGFKFIKEDLDVTDEEPEDGDEVDTDYTQLEDDTIDTADEESGDEVNDTVEDETTTDEQQGNDTVDENDPEADPATDEEETGTDYTDMGNDETTGEEGTGEDEEGGDTSSEGEEEVPEESSGNDTEDKSKRYYLLKDFVTLFSIVKEGYKAVSTAKTYDTNKLIVLKKVSENLEVLQDYMYMYLTQVFDKSSYIENLTNYNFFSSSLSANIKMIKDVNELSTYVQE